MPVAERTYSFKAPASLGERVRKAGRVLAEGQDDAVLIEELARRLAVDLPHELAEATDRDTQSALFRGVLMMLVSIVEGLEQERRYAAEYAATAQEHDADAESFFQAAHAASAAMWRDED